MEEEEQQRRINQIYSGMEAWCTQEIEAFYGRYATAEGIDITEAKKRVSQADIEQYEALAKQYVKDRDFSDEANQAMRLYNATMKINRLELLKAQIGLHMVGGTDEIAKYYEETITNRTMDELERQSGILGKPLKEEDALKKAKNIVNASFYNATFSERIWSHCDNLRNEIGIELQKGLIAGVGSRQMAANLRKKYQVSASDAHRLMVTELRRVQTDVALDSYKENGIEEFEFMAVNPRACEICKEMDGKVFPVSELEAGVNAPPIHPRCHCTTAPHMDEDEYNAWLSWLENGGTTEQWDAMSEEERRTGRTQEPTTTPEVTPFTPAKTIQEAEEYAQRYTDNDRFGALGVSFDGVGLDVANIINKTIGWFYDTFDVPKFGGIKAPRGNTKEGRLVENATAGYSPIRNSFYLNRKKMKNVKIATEELSKDNVVIRDVIARPERYYIDRMSPRIQKLIENSKISGRGLVPESVEDVINHELGHSLEKKLRKDPNYEEIKRRMNDYAPNISGYACDCESEYIAESFCSYMKGEGKTDPLLVEAFERLKR